MKGRPLPTFDEILEEIILPGVQAFKERLIKQRHKCDVSDFREALGPGGGDAVTGVVIDLGREGERGPREGGGRSPRMVWKRIGGGARSLVYWDFMPPPARQKPTREEYEARDVTPAAVRAALWEFEEEASR
jgi:hypothetical protein